MGVVVVRTAKQPEPLVEAMVERARPLGEAEVPLPYEARPVATAAQLARERRHPRRKPGRVPKRHQDVANARAGGVTPGQEAGAGRRADRRVRVEAREARA